MARVPASIYPDEDASVVVAAILRARGFDATTLNACIGTGSKKRGRTQGFLLPGGDLPEMLLPGWADCWLAWVPRT